MKIIEQLVVGKKSQEECEDGIIVNENFAAVIDGSTSKTPIRMNGLCSNGRYCMELIKNCINSISSDIDVYGFCQYMTKSIYSKYIDLKIDVERLKLHPEERLTASAIVYSSKLRQLWMIGDCQCLVGGCFYDNLKPYEQELAEQRALFLREAINNGITPESVSIKDCGRESILPELVKCCRYQNVSYAVIDGFDIPMDKVRVINVDEGINELVLASDGYPFLKPTLDESEAMLASQLENDPLCMNTFKATKGLMAGNKSFDDRSYLRVGI